MPDSHRFRLLVARLPAGIGGAVFHRWGLEAMHECRYLEADRLFERGAAAYRHEISIEPLARIRVHQLMARVKAGRETSREAEMCLQVERLLSGLDRIESPEPGFELVKTHSLLASWYGASGPAAPVTAAPLPAVSWARAA